MSNPTTFNAQALDQLIAKWRRFARMPIGYRATEGYDGSIHTLNRCAKELEAALALRAPSRATPEEHHKLDTASQVFFYEQDFYVLSNFSAFNLHWAGHTFPTSEHAYHWEKFNWIARHEQGTSPSTVKWAMLAAPSAHAAFKMAEEYRSVRRPDWDAVKVDTMREILRAKAEQHDYVRRKLLATGNRELIEDSWRDDFWGWGPNRDGQNMLGKLWMEIRAELLASRATSAPPRGEK